MFDLDVLNSSTVYLVTFPRGLPLHSVAKTAEMWQWSTDECEIKNYHFPLAGTLDTSSESPQQRGAQGWLRFSCQSLWLLERESASCDIRSS